MTVATAPKRTSSSGYAMAQRLSHAIDPSEIRLAPGQYMIRTPEHFEELTVAGRKQRILRPYNGTAYGVRFENNVAIIDDESVKEIRDVMLDELEGDETRLPPWFRDPNGDAAALARKLQSDFGYAVHPPLPKLKRLTKAQIAASAPYDETDELVEEQVATAKPGEDGALSRRTAPSTGRTIAGVDKDVHVKTLDEVEAEMVARADAERPAKRRGHGKGKQ